MLKLHSLQAAVDSNCHPSEPVLPTASELFHVKELKSWHEAAPPRVVPEFSAKRQSWNLTVARETNAPPPIRAVLLSNRDRATVQSARSDSSSAPPQSPRARLPWKTESKIRTGDVAPVAGHGRVDQAPALGVRGRVADRNAADVRPERVLGIGRELVPARPHGAAVAARRAQGEGRVAQDKGTRVEDRPAAVETGPRAEKRNALRHQRRPDLRTDAVTVARSEVVGNRAAVAGADAVVEVRVADRH
jgi:hypothetical protein